MGEGGEWETGQGGVIWKRWMRLGREEEDGWLGMAWLVWIAC